MSVTVRVESVGKAYRLGVANREALLTSMRKSWAGEDEDLFWALRDVSFDVEEGQVVGILGHNGAGKSTLLKILSQITTPTRGRVLLRGRVASLLEVGTGFHPELTGRDNIFLNGAILGMTRQEVARRFDEIVAFAEVEDFIHTPAKRYSSGMRVRLAFAVAAHLEPEILILDEVLAVGDAAFQRKCLGKIGDVARAGRTVLFVSHNAAAVQSLCTRGIVLERGAIRFEGTQTEAIEYYAAGHEQLARSLRDRTDRTGSGEVRVVGMEIRTASGTGVGVVHSGQDIEVHIHFEMTARREFPELAVRLFAQTQLGAPVFMHSNHLVGRKFGPLPSAGTFVCRIPRLPLPAASYRLGFRVATAFRHFEVLDGIQHALDLQVEKGDFFGSGELPSAQAGVALVDADWRMQPEDKAKTGSGSAPEPQVSRDPSRAGALGEPGPLSEETLI